MRGLGASGLVLALLLGGGCDRREEVPAVRDRAACQPLDLGAAEALAERTDLPVDRVVTIEGMPHQAFFGWTEGGRSRAVSKLLGTERRVLLLQDFEGESPPTSSRVTGLLRRWSDLPGRPFDQVKAGIETRFGWTVPLDAYVVLEGRSPRGCD